MKIFQLRSLVLLTFLSVFFVGCDNEPLEGEFVIDEPVADPGQFVATIDGTTFTATTVRADIVNGGLVVVGINEAEESITLTVANKSECIFNLNSLSTSALYTPAGGPGTGIYNSFGFGSGLTSGTLEITNYDVDEMLVSGTFDFVAVEYINGQPATETVTVTGGSFTAIPFAVQSGDPAPAECDPNGGGSSGGGSDPDTFSAVVDGEDFVPTNLEVTQYMVGMEPMIQVKATNVVGATVRLDIPETLLTGTFSMFDGISDGTRLIGYYNGNDIGETLSSNPGSITITEFSSQTGRLVADFSFTARDPLNNDPTVVQVTDGSLAVNFVPTPGNVSFFFEADVNGSTFQPETVTATQDIFEGVNVITVSASVGDQLMELNFPASIGPGIYGMSPLLVSGSEVVGSYVPGTTTGIVYTSDPGTLEILSFDAATGVIEGTFSFMGKDATNTDPAVFEITNGSFLVELQ